MTLRRSLTLRAAAWLAALVVAACGGGVETGGTGPTGSSFVEGPVNGFGSVIVAGIRFDESRARIEDADGTLRDRNELRLGMRLEIEGGAVADDSDGGRSARASRVRIVAELLAPVTSVDAGALWIDVLGQTVRVNAATVVDGVAGGVPALGVGDVVEVHGFVDPGWQIDRYVATRIERRNVAPAAYRVRGLVRDLDVAARTMRVGSQAFDLSAVNLPAGLADGRIVRLVVGTAMVGGRWPVSAISLVSRTPPDSDEAEIEGLITALASVTRFDVDGMAVDAGAAAFEGGTGGIVLGARVKVSGRAAGGVLVATGVETRTDDDAFNDGVDLRDLIANLDTAAQTFTVRGVTVFYGASPRYDNGTVADLANDRRVRVRATLSPDRTRLVATRIEFVVN